MFTFGTLFTGCEGAGTGLEMAGFKSIWGIERDERIAKIAQLNFPNSIIINDCVSQVKPHRSTPVDLLWMSPPYQQYSQARRGDIADHEDKDAGLYCSSFIEAINPRWVILENVPGYAKSPVFEKILKDLKYLGYRYHWQILDAADYGVPQHRKRLIMWAVREDEKLPFFPQPKLRVGWYQAIAHLIPELPDCELAEWQVKRLEKIDQSSPLLMPRAGANIKGCNPTPSDQPCPTIRAMARGRHTHWADILADGLIKQITPKATALLQTFPESYQLPESKTLAQQIIGNAVPPLLAKELGLAILQSIKNENINQTPQKTA